MPSYTRGKKRQDLVFVPTSDYCLYGFKIKDIASIGGVTQDDITALGFIPSQTALTTTGKIKVMGASAPKPPRVTKKIENAAAGQQQSVSTFCAYNKLAAAQQKEWKITKQRKSVILRANTASRPSLTAVAKLSDNSLYCFPMNKADFDEYGAKLGLKNSSTITSATEKGSLVAGSSIPRPGKASLYLSNGSTFTSFYATASLDEAVTQGFDILSEEMILGASATTP